MKLRIGEGWDIHALVDGRKLILGGVEIPYSKGLLGHSDADALLHAITDAVLGAAALGDIGTHFPDTDARFKAQTQPCCWPRRLAVYVSRVSKLAMSIVRWLPKRPGWLRTYRPCAGALPRSWVLT